MFSLPVPPTSQARKVTFASQFRTLRRKPGNMQRKLRFSRKSSASTHPHSEELVRLRVRSQGLAARSHHFKSPWHGMLEDFPQPNTYYQPLGSPLALVLTLPRSASRFSRCRCAVPGWSHEEAKNCSCAISFFLFLKDAIENHDFHPEETPCESALSAHLSAHSSPPAAFKSTSQFQENLAVGSQK